MRGFTSFLILPVLALVFLFVYFSFVNPRALIEFARWLEKLFSKFSSFSKCVQIAFLRLVLLRLRFIKLSHRHRTRSILDWRVCCLAPLICFIRRDLRDHGPRWRRPRLPAACCTCACGASVRTRGGSKNRCQCRRGSMSAFGGKADMARKYLSIR